MKLLAAALAAAALGLPAAQASPPTALGLVYTPGYGNSMVARYDPVTLERSGPRIRLGGNASSWGWSPGRRYLAVASFPQRLTVIEVATMRVVSRVRLASGGASVRAVTWARGDRVLAVVETPQGSTVTAVDPLAGRVVRTTVLTRPFTFELARLPDGLVFLLGARDRIESVRLAAVDAEGRVRVAAITQVRAGFVVGREQQTPGLAVDPVGRKAYVVGGDRVVTVDLRTLATSDRGPLRTLTKFVAGKTRSAEWLGNGLLAFSGTNWNGEDNGPAGLRVVDVRSWTTRIVNREARSFTVAADRLLVENALPRRAVVVAYGFDGAERYRLELAESSWMKKQGNLGYSCRQASLRSVVDLRSGRVLRDGFGPGTRCPTLLVNDSRG